MLHEHVYVARTRNAPKSPVEINTSRGARGMASTMSVAPRVQIIGQWRSSSTANKVYDFKYAECVIVFSIALRIARNGRTWKLYLTHDFWATHVHSCSGRWAAPPNSNPRLLQEIPSCSCKLTAVFCLSWLREEQNWNRRTCNSVKFWQGIKILVAPKLLSYHCYSFWLVHNLVLLAYDNWCNMQDLLYLVYWCLWHSKACSDQTGICLFRVHPGTHPKVLS